MKKKIRKWSKGVGRKGVKKRNEGKKGNKKAR